MAHIEKECLLRISGGRLNVWDLGLGYRVQGWVQGCKDSVFQSTVLCSPQSWVRSENIQHRFSRKKKKKP